MENVAAFKFFWSETFHHSINKLNETRKALKSSILEAIDDKDLEFNTTLAVIGSHLYSPLTFLTHDHHFFYWLEHEEDHVHFILQHIILPFQEEVMPEILQTLAKKPWMKVYFLAAHVPIRANEKIQKLTKIYVDAYNKLRINQSKS